MAPLRDNKRGILHGLTQFFRTSSKVPDPTLRRSEARLLYQEASDLGYVRRFHEAIWTSEILINGFGEDEDQDIPEYIAKSLVNKANYLDQVGRGEEALKTCDEVVRRFDGAVSPLLREALVLVLSKDPS